MNILEKIEYILSAGKSACRDYGIVAIVDTPKGAREIPDSDDDYFDHKFIDQHCFEDDCWGMEYIPIDDGSGKYFAAQYHC